MNRDSLTKVWLWLRVLLAGCVTLSLFNYPRTWWQEIVCATSLLWSGFFVVVLCLDIVRFRAISWTLSRLTLVALQVLCVVRTGQIVMPYLYAPQRAYPDLAYSAPVRLLFIDISERSGNAHGEALRAFVEVEQPSMIIVTRYGDAPILESLADRYPSRFVSPSSGDRVVEVLSKLEPKGAVRVEYGYAALPAVIGEFATDDGYPVVIGAFDLLPPWRQEDFLRSRLTSRRLATVMKYTSKPRIVFGAFRTSPTSQIVEMYPDQVRLRGLSFDSGISFVPELIRMSLNFEEGQHIFTARTILCSRVVESKADGGGFSAVLFDARIPRESPRS